MHWLHAVSLELNIPFEKIQQALNNFDGVNRRFTICAKGNIKPNTEPVVVIDDYGHHPVEIEATLQAARDSGRKIPSQQSFSLIAILEFEIILMNSANLLAMPIASLFVRFIAPGKSQSTELRNKPSARKLQSLDITMLFLSIL